MYGEYAHWLEAVEGIRCARSTLLSENDYSVDPDTYLEALADADFAILVNPNNPTGRAASRDFIRAVLDALPRFGWLVVDETYSDFAEEALSVESWVETEEKLIVLKSLSKFWALSGLRVGYLAAHRDIVKRLLPRNPPWAVGLIAQVAALEALRDGGYYQAMATRTRELRSSLAAALSAIPSLRVIPSVANYLLVELPPGIESADVVARAQARGVYLRDCDGQLHVPTGRLVRTAVKDEASNARIAAALADGLAAKSS